jgi:hypothetical protein
MMPKNDRFYWPNAVQVATELPLLDPGARICSPLALSAFTAFNANPHSEVPPPFVFSVIMPVPFEFIV